MRPASDTARRDVSPLLGVANANTGIKICNASLMTVPSSAGI